MLFVRDVVRIGRKSPPQRVVGLFCDRAFLFDLAADQTLIIEHSLAALTHALEKGRAEQLDGHEFNAPPIATPTHAQQQRAEQRLKLIVSLVGSGEEIFDRAQRSRLVALAAREAGVCGKTVHSALKRYWRGGMTIYALMPQFQNCGGPGQQKTATGPLGRKPNRGIKRAPALTDEMRDAFKRSCNRYYKKNRHVTLRDTYHHALELLCTRCVYDQETGAPVTFVVDQNMVAPSWRQFHYWYLKQKRAKSDAKARLGATKFALRSRARTSYAAQDNNNAGGRFVIDSTKLDVNCVSRSSRSTFVGTLVLYIVVDEFTAMIAGFWLSLEEASWNSAAMAILNCVEDKVEFARAHGIEIEPSRWPVGGMMPLRLLFDRGEAKGDLASGFVVKAGQIVENTAPYRGDLKGVDEKRFDLINVAFRGEVPGARDKESGKRGEDDPRKEAILNLDEIIRLVLLCILYLNDKEIPTFRRSRAMIADQVPPIPSAMWRWCLNTGRVALQRADPAELAISLMPTGKAKLTAQGLRFRGLFYTCERAEIEGWFEAVDAPGFVRQLQLSYHPWLVDTIYLHLPGEARPERAILTQFSQPFAGLSFDEVAAIRCEGRAASQERQLDQVALRADFRNQVHAIVAQASRERLADLRPRDLQNARLAKAAEREERRDKAREEMRQQNIQQEPARPAPRSLPPLDDDLGEGPVG